MRWINSLYVSDSKPAGSGPSTTAANSRVVARWDETATARAKGARAAAEMAARWTWRQAAERIAARIGELTAPMRV